MAELIAAYSPPMPAPARTLVAYRNRNQYPPGGVSAVSPPPTRYTASVIMNRFRRPSLSDSLPKNSAPMTWPIRYQVAMSATAPADMFSVLARVRSGPTLAAIVISSPSRTHATPSAVTIRVWNFDQGSRSMRAGIRLLITGLLLAVGAGAAIGYSPISPLPLYPA
jgi:hypothetical protein